MLPGNVQPLFDAQVAGINRVQRSPPAWSAISFYCLRSGKADWSGVPAFPCTDEFRLAEVRFRLAGAGYKATLYSVSGHIFEFAITPGSKAVAFATWEEEPRATLLDDPNRPPVGRKEPEPLPLAWHTFLERHPTEPPRGWALHDEDTAHRVALEDGEYLILAERAGEEFILHRVEPQAEELFHLRECDGSPERLTRGLDEIMGYDGD